jgi:hypothetical protein
MTNEGNLKVTARGDREIVMTRAFDAPRTMVFDAFTKPELVKRWMLGPGAGLCRSARSISGRAARIATCGVTTPTGARWDWAASIAKSWCQSGLSPRRSSTRLGTRARPSVRSF